MAHLLAPERSFPELPVFFNVDKTVGAPPAENLREDVLFVQFAFKVIADAPTARTGPELLAAAKAVNVTGSIDPATINAIRVVQQEFKKEAPGQIVDGRVSPARRDYSYSRGVAWIIVHLNDSIQGRNLDIWPRIDKIPGCPIELQKMVIRTVAGT